MYLRDLSEELNFDEFPKKIKPNEKLIITHIPHTLTATLPKQSLPIIYTTKQLQWKLKAYLKSNNAQMADCNFVLLQPYVPLPLKLSDGTKVELLAGEAANYTGNIMVLIRIGDDLKVSYLYAGICTHIRAAILNDTFASWLGEGVEHLYLDLRRSTEPCDYRSMQNVIEKIEQILYTRDCNKIQIIVPIFGYEQFIFSLAEKLRARVALSSNFLNIFKKMAITQHFLEDVSNAKILITHREPTLQQMIYEYKTHKLFFIKIVDTRNTSNAANNNDVYSELQWSPLPTPFELELIAQLVHPKHISGIILNKHNFVIRAPEYLYKYCKAKSPEKTAAKSPLKPKAPTQSQETKNSTNQQTTPLYCLHKRTLNYVDESESGSD